MDLNALRMTKNEKKLNYNDLQAFKEVDPSLYAMIPGWSPQIGGLKIKKKLQEVQVPLNEEPMNKKPVFSPNIFSAKNRKFFIISWLFILYIYITSGASKQRCCENSAK